MSTWTDWDIEPVARSLIMANNDPAFCAGVYALATALGVKLDYRLSGWLYRWPMDRSGSGTDETQRKVEVR